MEVIAKAYPSSEYVMKGGNDLLSYAQNSKAPLRAIEAVTFFLNNGISEKLLVESFSSKTFCIADYGCATGPNTFFAVQNIINAVKLKYQTQGYNTSIPEFQVCFSDHTSNDFNTLFASLPPGRQYYTSGVPGSFYGRLFPIASLHIAYSSYALHWLSRVPKEVINKDSSAWNRGKITYAYARDEVVEEYSKQYAKDFELFLKARAQEIVPNGLMAIVLPGRPNGAPHSKAHPNGCYEILGSCLNDLAKEGLIMEELVDGFNIPIYHPSTEEMEAVIQKNGHFTIEKMEIVPILLNLPEMDSLAFVQSSASTLRAVLERVIEETFGEEIIDELFERFIKKLQENLSVLPGIMDNVFVLLKRNA